MTENKHVSDTPTPREASRLAETRARLASSRSSSWRSLEELAETPQFEETLAREFPRQAAEWNGLDRRRFLQLSGASLGLAGLAACTKQPPEKVVPYVRQPEDIVPGKPLFFATAVEQAGYAAPVLAESHMGRPTKVEGNPDHPASLGATSAITQATTLEIYDPDRAQAITHLNQIRTWPAFLQQAAGLRSALVPLAGDGLAILTGTVTSPTLVRLLGELLEEMPQARWFQYEASAGPGHESALRAATGGAAALRFDFTQADVVLAVDSDFLHTGPGAVRYARDFASRRKAYLEGGGQNVSRLYSVETMPTGTSSVADHRLALTPTNVGHFLVALASKLGVGGGRPGLDGELVEAWVDEVAADLQAHAGRSAVVVGEWADEELHTLALAINQALGNIGTTVLVTEPVAADSPTEASGLTDLLQAIDEGGVSTLLFFDVNPVYAAPTDLPVAATIDKVPLRVYCGSHVNETGERCHWFLPKSHDLETWGDLRAFDGTATICQPIVGRLYDSVSPSEIVAALLGRPASAEELVRETWREQLPDQKTWRRALHDGFVDGTEAAPASLSAPSVGQAASTLAAAIPGALEILFRPDPTVFDGRYANNGWLQELPKPITRLTWDNALFMSPATARAVGFDDLFFHGDFRVKVPRARLTVGERELDLPVWVVPGLADGALVLHTGYGRRMGGSIAVGPGFDANQVRHGDSPWSATEGVGVREIGGTYALACTQDHFSMEGRPMAMDTNVLQLEATPDNPLGIHLHVDPNASMMDERANHDWVYDTYAWGMSIDLSSCTGCNACVIACQSENNIPVVGKDQVAKAREMHWIRVDRYFVGDDPNDVEAVMNQPVPCMQCEQAPCEVVCPVAATVHSDEGLNDMVYNRCVGTRYCSNNCPYKVRRFNFLLYQDFDTPQLKLGRNPDVTVRSRGVMEKCTYCVQRINEARHEAKRESRRIQDGEVVTACQQACPADAIVFGDINDRDSAVSARKRSNLDYTLLPELGNRPRTTYMGRVYNRNPQLWARIHPDRPLVEEHHADHGGAHGDDYGGDHADGTSHPVDHHDDPAAAGEHGTGVGTREDLGPGVGTELESP